jgi:hypothetical protein
MLSRIPTATPWGRHGRARREPVDWRVARALVAGDYRAGVGVDAHLHPIERAYCTRMAESLDSAVVFAYDHGIVTAGESG